MEEKDFYLIARITAAAGRNGFVRVHSYSDFPERFFDLKYVYIDFFNEKKKIYVDEVKLVKNQPVIKFKNFGTAGEVELLIDKEILVDQENLFKLPGNHYYIHDLIGSKVYRNNMLVGIITDVLNLPANDVYVLNDAEGNELMLPAIKDIILSFDPDKKEMVLKPGDDLYEADEN